MNGSRVIPKIDQEFASMIDPLTDDEFQQLKENILEDNEVHSPLILWNGVLLDGHNRWKIIRENPGISYSTKELIFLSREAAIEWVCKNQLGRRNITEEQRKTLIGKMQRARKKSHGGERGNQYTTEAKVQNEPLPKSTAAQIAEEMGVSESYVKRAEKFADGVDAIREISPEAAQKVTSGKSGKTQTQVAAAAKMEPKQRKEFVESIINPPAPEPKPESPKYTVDTLIDEINASTNTYIRFVRETLARHNDCYDTADNGQKVLESIALSINKIQEIQTLIKERYDVQQS